MKLFILLALSKKNPLDLENDIKLINSMLLFRTEFPSISFCSGEGIQAGESHELRPFVMFPLV